MRTIDDIYASRCYADADGGLLPTFWVVGSVTKEPFSFFGDETTPVPEGAFGVQDTIEKILALNYRLELPVGQFVSGALKRELPDYVYTQNLLKSNIADEGRHFDGFSRAVQSYGSRYINEADELGKMWETVSQDGHPLMTPMVLEVGLFLAALGLLRIAGGKSLSTLAAKVSEDEFRHVLTNRTILDLLGEQPFNPPQNKVQLLRDTLDWVFSSINIPRAFTGVTVNKDFLMKSAFELLYTGLSETFNDLVYIADYSLPFERSNKDLYTRQIGVI